MARTLRFVVIFLTANSPECLVLLGSVFEECSQLVVLVATPLRLRKRPKLKWEDLSWCLQGTKTAYRSGGVHFCANLGVDEVLAF